jgi:hypothetical protein
MDARATFAYESTLAMSVPGSPQAAALHNDPPT